MASGTKIFTIFTFEEILKHQTIDDCWLVIAGKVYDVTSFMYEHPGVGGHEFLLSATGKDATNDFKEAGHSDFAREKKEQFYIGEIDPSSTVPLKRLEIEFDNSYYSTDKTLKIVIKFLVALMILGLDFMFRKYTQKE